MHGEGECVGRREVYTSVGMMKRARRHKQRTRGNRENERDGEYGRYTGRMGCANLVDTLSDTEGSGPAGGCGLPPEKSSGSTQRKWNGHEPRRDFRCFGEHCAVHSKALVARSTSLEPLSTGAAIGTSLTVVWKTTARHKSKEMKCFHLGRCFISGH